MRVYEVVKIIDFEDFWRAFNERYQMKAHVDMSIDEDMQLAKRVYVQLGNNDSDFDIGGTIKLFKECIWRNTYIEHESKLDKKIWLDYIPWKEIANMEVYPYYDETGEECTLDVFLALMYFDMTYHGVDYGLFDDNSEK